MRGGVLEPLEHENTPLQAVIVKNGKIFVDSIEPLPPGEDSNNNQNHDENLPCSRQADQEPEEFDLPDDDDDDVDHSKFSQEAFDCFMRAGDSDEDQLGDILILNQLQNPPPSEEVNDTLGLGELREDERLLSPRNDTIYLKQDYGAVNGPYFIRELPPHAEDFPDLLNGGSPVPLSPVPTSRVCGFRRRDSLNMEEYSTFSEDVDHLLSEDMDSSWRYVPLYPETYYR